MSIHIPSQNFEQSKRIVCSDYFFRIVEMVETRRRAQANYRYYCDDNNRSTDRVGNRRQRLRINPPPRYPSYELDSQRRPGIRGGDPGEGDSESREWFDQVNKMFEGRSAACLASIAPQAVTFVDAMAVEDSEGQNPIRTTTTVRRLV